MPLIGLVLGVGLTLQTQAPAPSLSLTVDSSRHEITVRAGPYDVAPMGKMSGLGMMDHEMAGGIEGMGTDTPLLRFDWPVDGWARGFRISVVDREGREVPRRALHHLILVNFDRRQLLYPMLERLLGAGSETEDVSLPRSVGIPVRRGMAMGLYLGWHNEGMASLEGVSLRLTIQWMPRNQAPEPVSVLPLYMDANLTVGVSNAFDVPPGHSERSWTFTMPLSGRLLGVGGHLHDYGTALRLEEVARNRTLITLTARRDSAGRVLGLGRKLFGVSGEGLLLKAGRVYRIVGVYDNPTGQLRRGAAMAHMVGLFVPRDLSRWPAVDWSDSVIHRDVAALNDSAALVRPMEGTSSP
jgi:hypothetical protein